MKTSFVSLSLMCMGLLAATACNNENSTSATDNANTAAAPMANGEGTSDDLGVATAENSRTAPANLNGSTLTGKEFMLKADQGGHNEIGLSQLALEKGVTGATKTFANEMIADHTKAGNELKAIAQK